jgi:hypothetical protein
MDATAKMTRICGNHPSLWMWITMLVMMMTFLLLLLLPSTILFNYHQEEFAQLPEPLIPFRPLGIALLNSLMMFSSSSFPPSLKASDIISMAKWKTGLNEFYDDANGTFVQGLNRVTTSIEKDSKLNYFGRIMIRIQIDIVVENRLKIGHYYFTKQQSHQQKIKSPSVFILGMPRSGSTFLHNLLSLDEETFHAPRLWEIVDPVPPPDPVNSPWNSYIRQSISEIGTSIFRYLNPNFAKVHPVSSTNAEECMPIMALNMLSYYFNTMSNVSTYNDWLFQQNITEALIWHDRFLQVLGQHTLNRQWLLKAPWHMNHLESILEVYPDAKIIVTHRDPAGMLASLSSLHARLYGMTSDHLDLKAIGEYQQKMWTIVVDRFVQARRKLRKTSKNSQIYDISFGALSDNPAQIVEQVYGFLNLKLRNATKLKMKTWLENDIYLGKKGAAGVHVYRQEWFGLNEQEISQIPSFIEYARDFL